MSSFEITNLLYILFIWLVLIHTFEEIACDIFSIELGFFKMNRRKYLIGASIISSTNLVTLALLILQHPVGHYLGLFTSSILGVFQGIIHAWGYFMENRKMKNLGAGFYSSIPLAFVGLILFLRLLKTL